MAERDGLLGAVAAAFPYGLLVVSAPESTDAHIQWDPSETVHAAPDSIYVGVRQLATGLVEVICREGTASSERLHLAFEGELFLPSMRLRIHEPNDTVSLTISLDSERVGIRLYVDDSEEPSRVLICVT